MAVLAIISLHYFSVMLKSTLLQILFGSIVVIGVNGEYGARGVNGEYGERGVNGEYGAIGPIKSNFSSAELNSVIEQLKQDDRKAVVITNEADDWFTIWFTTNAGDTKEYSIQKGQSMAVSFRTEYIPRILTFVYCTLAYKGFWAHWIAYREFVRYINIRDKVFHYTVRTDGIYIKEKMIGSLISGKNWYGLWDHKDSSGLFLNGYVNKGICNNVPRWMANKASSIRICADDCVILYKGFGCYGHRETHQGHGECRNEGLNNLNDKVRSIKGC